MEEFVYVGKKKSCRKRLTAAAAGFDLRSECAPKKFLVAGALRYFFGAGILDGGMTPFIRR